MNYPQHTEEYFKGDAFKCRLQLQYSKNSTHQTNRWKILIQSAMNCRVIHVGCLDDTEVVSKNIGTKHER